MNVYEKSIVALEELFAKDFQFALATAKDNVPSVRIIDTFYHDEAFYIVTYGKSKKAQEIEKNKHVSLCNQLYNFTGEAYHIGHPLDEKNSEIRSLLIKVFEPWYFEHNNEADEEMCYVKVELKTGFFYKDGMGYRVNFEHKEATEFPFQFDIMLL